MQEKNQSKNSYTETVLEDESINLLDWHLLKRHLSSFASTEMGKQAILSFVIPSEYDVSKRLLNETVEITELENNLDKSISFSDVFDIKRNIEICSKGGVILSSDLLEIAKTIAAARNLKDILLDFEQRPFISSFTKNLIDHQNIETILKNGIEPNGRISDNASSNLSILRKELLSKKLERKTLVDKFIQKNLVYLQDSIIGDRYGRPVVAVKVNYVDKFSGIIHDSSSSGNTVYFEPDSVVKKGNKIASLEARVTAEEFKLLQKWSQVISDNSENLIAMVSILLRLENALTRSRYSKWIGGKTPILGKDPIVSLIGFSHPLLIWENKKKGDPPPVAVDFHINRNIKVVAITGPNTGGKTAALKGLGLSLLMARSGLLIPSTNSPVIPFCPNIYVDIGDNQSLEENLSTFSGHISRIKKILELLENRRGLSIVLLDEIGSGTDPVEGSALAMALLKEFANKSDITLATTHYGDIKALKYNDSRFENASVAFDDDSFKPKYILNWGIPGRSNALSISKRLGLNESILSEAANYLKPKEVDNINSIIKGLEDERIKQQKSAEAAAELIARTEILHDELKKNYEFQKINAEKIQEIERYKLSKHILSAKKEVIDLIKKLRDQNVSGEDTRIIGKRLKEIETEHLTQKRVEKSISWNPKVGDFVKIKSLNSKGQIVDLDKKGGYYEVKCGSFRSTLSANDFEGVNGEKPNFKKSKIDIKSSREDFSFSKIRTSKNTIDVRGLRVHEAEIIIEEKIRKFHGPLWIVHGIGTGKLKKGLREWLSGLNYVDKIEDAATKEGGPGCSIAWIK
ncbi:Recombination inhibitory protein MutS2 [Prochlorococcus marinus str. MIT 9123]|uniref:Endonuclease MutS2 n=1 Tax=Prochlorococcus marinus str. MIT 9116 TaxID=167544 RepID=A0A0A1ZP29_PROMR|nr:endonuclease MutS2 [Prochlorococcus marinus]KGF89948.1 Recombination inhibitory protein MutS2 [Prochlorococcus marinus str. MIT 9116]KGF95383.1 Recombination inhibitory protein MutS2 [Prochlorococcus marinus str. MIT 9123]